MCPTFAEDDAEWDSFSPQQIEQLLAVLNAFDAACPMPAAEATRWCLQWQDASTLPLAANALLLSGFQHANFDLLWLHTAIDLLPQLFSEDRRIGLLRRAMQVQVDCHRRPDWREYQRFGVDAVTLNLLGPDDYCYLGQVLAERYQLDVRFAQGGLAVIYLATDLQTSERVAVKIPLRAPNCWPPEEVEEQDPLAKLTAIVAGGPSNSAKLTISPFCEHVLKEANFLQTLQHPNIPRWKATLDWKGIPILVMEYVEGETFQSMIQSGALSNTERIEMVVGVARVADDLHQAGWLHGDIKAENILVRPDKSMFLLDFNVSRTDKPWEQTDGERQGTLGAMSPENLVGVAADVDLRGDIFALGALLYYAVQGTALMTAKELEDALVKAVLTGGVYGAEVSSDDAKSLETIINAAIARQMNARFETAADFAAACEGYLKSGTACDPLPAKFPRLSSWRLGCSVGMAMVRQRQWETHLNDLNSLPPGERVPKQFLQHLILPMGVTLALDEAQPLAERLGVTLGEFSQAEVYRTAFFRAPRGLHEEGLQQLRQASLGATDWLRETLPRLESCLESFGLAEKGLFLTAIQARFCPYSPEAAARWATCAAATPLPKECYQSFIAHCTTWDPALDWMRPLQELDYLVCRHLRWHSPDGARCASGQVV